MSEEQSENGATTPSGKRAGTGATDDPEAPAATAGPGTLGAGGEDGSAPGADDAPQAMAESATEAVDSDPDGSEQGDGDSSALEAGDLESAGGEGAADESARDDSAGPAGSAVASTRDAGGSGRSLGGAVALLALVVAALGLAGTGFLWWQYRQFYVSLNEADVGQRGTLETLATGQATLNRLLDQLQQAQADYRDQLVDMRTTIGDFPQQVAALDRRVDALQGRSVDARDEWLRAEAEYYLVVANTEAGLRGRVESAITALELADGLLRELGDPALNTVRVAIADELTGLRAIPLTDNEGLAFSLASLATRVADFPFRAANVGEPSYELNDGGVAEVEPGIGRLWASLKQALLGIVRIERRDAPVEVQLSAGERELVRRQVVVELQLARVALLSGENETFRAGLVAAGALLEREFDTGAQDVAGAIALLAELGGLDIAPPQPDLSGSLSLLRGAGGSTD